MKLSLVFKVLQIKAGLLAWGALALAGSGDPQGFRDYAPVVNVEPIVETSYEPVMHQTCADPQELAPGSYPVASTIGEDIRHQIRLSQARDDCHTVIETDRQARVTGYWVTYRYRGRTSRTRLSYDPGSQMPVDVDLSPLP